ncbi:hypothetical protein [Enterovibrio coralii]|uniref:Hemolysin n=1 Tax=Enterovibrio coralii TaxID=294935 RepID=A0A135IB49_9GAMM|nr:hypothetical protein [Enterovibrio coralii]KXF82628.1 hypothetical protein ATN88_21440 [Enterovibrio coralii]
MKKKIIASLVLAAATTPSLVNANCFGNVYSMNAGRGHEGFIMDLKETQRLSGTYNGDRAIKASKALFSASAMAYDETTNRTYYVSSPRPTEYHVDNIEGDVSSDQFKNLDFHASDVMQNQLAYYDHASGVNVIVGGIPRNVYRMVFDPTQNQLVASDQAKVFTINPNNARVNVKGSFDEGLRNGGFTSWGDFVFYKDQLLYITNNRSYTLDLDTDPIGHELFGFHFTDFITAATLDQNGQVLIAAKNQNVNGNVNSTWLWRMKPETGEKQPVGLFPTRISALTTNTQELHECYDRTVFKDEEPGPEIEVKGGEVNEGEDAVFTITFNPVYEQDTDINLALEDVTAIYSSGTYDYFANSAAIDLGTEVVMGGSEITRQKRVTIPAGTESITVKVPVRDDHYYEVPYETFRLAVWSDLNRDSLTKATMTIIDDENEYAGLCGENFTPQATFSSRIPGESRDDFQVKLDCETGVLSFIDDYAVQGNKISGSVTWYYLDEYNTSNNLYGVNAFSSIINTEQGTQADSIEYLNPVGVGDSVGPEIIKNVYQVNSNITMHKPGNHSCGGAYSHFTFNLVYDAINKGPISCQVVAEEAYCDGIFTRYAIQRNSTCR